MLYLEIFVRPGPRRSSWTEAVPAVKKIYHCSLGQPPIENIMKLIRRCAYFVCLCAFSSLAIGCGATTPGANPADPNNPVAGTDTTTPTTGSGVAGTVSATLLEQLSLERINRARLRPGAEASSNGIAIDEGIPGVVNALPKQAVALNSLLNQSAGVHSQDMLDLDYFAHVSPKGDTPGQRIAAAGYVATGYGENLAWRGTTGSLNEVDFVETEHKDLFVDASVPSRGHRITMLEKSFREVGISILRGRFKDSVSGTDYDSIMQTQDYGTANGSGTFVLGVVYNDQNGNGQYDFNEGVVNATVSLNDVSKATNAAGGYSFEVRQAGAYTLKFPSFGRSQPVVIASGSPNIKLDLVNGVNVVINLGVGPLN